MHQHHAVLRLLLHLLAIVLVGLAIYLLLVYGLSRHAALSNTATSSPITTATSSPVTVTTSSPVSTSTSTSSPPIGTAPATNMLVVGESANSTVVQFSLHQKFIIQLGTGLNWSLVFTPQNSILRVASSTTAGVQGVYEADAAGTTTLHATGAPICKPDQACPMFLAVSTITFVVK